MCSALYRIVSVISAKFTCTYMSNRKCCIKIFPLEHAILDIPCYLCYIVFVKTEQIKEEAV